MKNHQQEIVASRTGGFGGSDAKLYVKIAEKGLSALSNTDKKRILVAKGMIEYEPINQTPAMNRGREFEDWFSKQSYVPTAEREVLLESNLAKNFRTFAHADFCNKETCEVLELKCVDLSRHYTESDGETISDAKNSVVDEYYEQLQHYYLLGAKCVWLIICDSRFEFGYGIKMPIFIERNDEFIEKMRYGIKLLDENWNEDFSIGSDWSSEDLLPVEQKMITEMSRALNYIAIYEAQVEAFKASLLSVMEENNIKSIKTDKYCISYVAASTLRKLNKSKLFKEHPEIDESDYTSASERKAYITVKLK